MEDFRFITFAGEVQSPKRKEKKDVKVKGFVRKGRFIQAFQRKQLLNQKENNNSNNTDKKELAKKVAISTAITGAAVLGVSLATYGGVKLRYNRNLLKLGHQMKAGKNTLKMRNDIRDYKPPTKLGDDKDFLTFILPGLPPNAERALGESKGTGGIIKKALKEANKEGFKKTEFINTGYTEMISNAKPRALDTITGDILGFTKKAALKAENKDAIAIAQEVFDWHKLNPDKNISFITHSAGGMIARDTTHILVNAGVPASKIKVLGVASPNYGIVDDIVDTQYIMHPDDMFANISVDKGNTRWIRSPKPQMEEFAGEDEVKWMKENKINEALAIHSAGSYWGKPNINKTAKSTVETATNFLFSKKS